MKKSLEDIIKMDIFTCRALLHRNRGEQYEGENGKVFYPQVIIDYLESVYMEAGKKEEFDKIWHGEEFDSI